MIRPPGMARAAPPHMAERVADEHGGTPRRLLAVDRNLEGENPPLRSRSAARPGALGLNHQGLERASKQRLEATSTVRSGISVDREQRE